VTSYLVRFRSYRSVLFKFRTLCVFEPPFGGWGLGTTYDVYLELIGKRVVDFLLVLIIEVFFIRCYGWVATSEKEIENRRYRSNAVNLIQNFR